MRKNFKKFLNFIIFLSFAFALSCGGGNSDSDTQAPTIPTNVKATATSGTAIVITWTAATDDKGVSGYIVYRNNVEINRPSSTTYSDSGLSPETAYSYTVKAFDAKGNTSSSSDPATATTLKTGEVLTTPEAPTNLIATAKSSTEILLSWTSSTSAGITGYYIFRNGQNVGSTINTSYSDTNLTPDSSYSYTVKAYNSAGNSTDSNTATAKTLKTGETPLNVNTLIQEAKTALENQDIATAKAKYELAYNVDPTNSEANFGSAITEFVMLLEDPDVVNLIKKSDSYVPTVKQLVYGVLANTFEVYGTNNYFDYGFENPATNSNYTKLTTVNTASPFIYNGSYTYYIVYVPPYSRITLDAVVASSGNQSNPYSTWGNFDGGWDMGTVGDGKAVTLGGKSTESTQWIIKANSGSTNVKIYSVGDAKAQRIRSRLAKALMENKNNNIDNIANQIKTLMDTLPKNKQSLFKKARLAYVEATSDTITASEVQTLIDNKLLPTINDMIKKLRMVEGKNYTFAVTSNMTSDGKATTLDDGEFYALDASLCYIRSLLDILTAYNLDVDEKILNADPISMINGTSNGITSNIDGKKFFTLKNTGADKMNNALTSLKEAKQKTKSAYDFIFNQWKYQTQGLFLVPTASIVDNGLSLHDKDRPNESFTVEEDKIIKNTFEVADLVLEGQITYKLDTTTSKETISNGVKTIIINETIDPDATDNSITFNVTKFFTNPLTRNNLPKFKYDLTINGPMSLDQERPVFVRPDGSIVDCKVMVSSDIPDWTFNGIFPNKITKEIDGIIYFDTAILVDQNVADGKGKWNENINIAASSDGNIYLRKSMTYYNYSSYDSYDSIKMFKINSANGAILNTYSGEQKSNTSNIIGNINQMVWYNNALWEAGYTYSSYSSQTGIFTESLTNLGVATSQIPLIRNTSYSDYIGSIAGNGTNLFLGISYSSYDNFLIKKSGIVKFDPNSTTQIPTSPFIFETDYTPYFTYDGQFLWVSKDSFEWTIKKVNPSNGSTLKQYICFFGIGEMYLNGRFWQYSDGKILRFKAPQ